MSKAEYVMNLCPKLTNFSTLSCDAADGGQPRPVVKQCAAPLLREALPRVRGEARRGEARRPILRHLRDKDDNEVSGTETGIPKSTIKKYFLTFHA